MKLSRCAALTVVISITVAGSLSFAQPSADLRPRPQPKLLTGAATHPNIVYILCDDLGYGDVSILNPQHGKIPTPHVDAFAKQGMIFTDCHSPSAVCTPTRYGILTGRYSWRSHLQSGVLQGDSPPLITAEHPTVASILREQGYTTAAIGKWHLGLTLGNDRFVDPIVDGPLQHGFDRFFGIAASLDMPPFAFIDQDKFTEPATATKKWGRTGPAAPSFEAVDVVPTLTKKATEYIASRAADAKNGKPFFLYMAFTSPHTPIVPDADFKGKSPLGAYGDFVMETDWATGQVLDAIDRAGLADDTLVIFTSDNGCSPAAGVAKLEEQGHFPSAGYRGYKADIWEGGHHIPFMARWPGHIAAGSTSNQIVCLIDLMATCAELTGAKMTTSESLDSVSLLPALLGTAQQPLREAVVLHSIGGNFAVRQGKWKLELCAGSGGWGAPREPEAAAQGLPPIQLYDMESDPHETTNIAAANPDVVKSLTDLLKQYIADGRSTPGPKQKNDAKIEINKKVRPATRPAPAAE